MDQAGECADCPDITKRLALMAAVVFGLLATLAVAKQLYDSRLKWRGLQIVRRLVVHAMQLGLINKLKLLFSFYQVAASLNVVYEAKLPAAYTRWVEQAFGWMELNLTSLLIPTACIGAGYEASLLLAALAPIALIVIVAAVLIGNQMRQALGTANSIAKGLLDSIPIGLAITFCCVSSVSQVINQDCA